MGVSVELHLAGHVEVDSGRVADLGVLVHPDGGGTDKVGGDPQLLGLVDEDVGDPEVSGSGRVQRHVVQATGVAAAAVQIQGLIALADFYSEIIRLKTMV